MSDTATLEAPAIEQVQTPEVDVNAAFNGVEKPAAQEPAIPLIPPVSQKPEESIFDESEYVKTNFGWESPDAGKAELTELRKLRELPKQEPITFANEDSKRIYDYIKEGKRSDLLKVLAAQEKLSEVNAYDLTKVDQAAEIIKLGMQYANRDLDSADVDFLFNKKFSIPPKPEKTDDKDDAEYAQEVSIWEKQVGLVEREMIIEAKLAKPNLAKFQSELVLPDIQGTPVVDVEAQRKESEARKTARETYLKTLDSNYKNFNGFTVTFKDDEVELPVSYAVSEQEKTALKEQLQDFNPNAFIDDLWFNEDGSPKVEQIMADVYFLRNREKILQKLVNESTTQRLTAYRKKTSNIHLEVTPQGNFQPSEKTKEQLQEDAIWSA